MIAERRKRRIVRYDADGVRYGDLRGAVIREFASNPFERSCYSGVRRDAASTRLLAPLIPGKIVGIGRNYRDHAREMGGEAPAWPDLFLKPSTAVIGPDEAIELPAASARVELEAELGVVIGRRLRDASPLETVAAVFGLTIVNDVTARDLQRSDRTWARAKGFDTFAPLGPCIATGLDWSDLLIESFVNGERKQRARTADMLRSVPELLAYVSAVMTLQPGDVVATGTPAGVSPIVAGDVVEIEIEGIGRLRNPVTERVERRERERHGR